MRSFGSLLFAEDHAAQAIHCLVSLCQQMFPLPQLMWLMGRVGYLRPRAIKQDLLKTLNVM
eukprot:299691-Amphidinium_carterae.1